jgi:hypothetical protein
VARPKEFKFLFVSDLKLYYVCLLPFFVISVLGGLITVTTCIQGSRKKIPVLSETGTYNFSNFWSDILTSSLSLCKTGVGLFSKQLTHNKIL